MLDMMNDSRCDAVQAYETEAPRIWEAGNNRASCSSLPSPFCRVTTRVLGPTKGGSNLENCELAVV